MFDSHLLIFNQFGHKRFRHRLDMRDKQILVSEIWKKILDLFPKWGDVCRPMSRLVKLNLKDFLANFVRAQKYHAICHLIDFSRSQN